MSKHHQALSAHLLSPTSNLPTPHPIYTPTSTVHGELTFIPDPTSVSRLGVEISGWQYSTASDKNSDLMRSAFTLEGGGTGTVKAPMQFSRKLFFRREIEIPLPIKDGPMRFSLDIPAGEDGNPNTGRNGPREALPPSLHLGKRTDKSVPGYNRYQVKITVTRKGMFKKKQECALPLLFIQIILQANLAVRDE